MREFSTPMTVHVPSLVERTGNLTDDLLRWAGTDPDRAVLARRGDDGTWVDVGAATFLAEVRAVAKGLVAAGIEVGDRVALISRTRYEWTLLDYAIWFAGAVSVPVYETSSTEQVAWVLGDSGARAAVVESRRHLARVSSVRADLEELRQVWSIDDHAVHVLRRLGGDVTDEQLEERRRTAGPGDLATLIYTSGTTDRPKGCRVTHGNLDVELSVAVAELAEVFRPAEAEDPDEQEPGEQASTLLFLPLAHVFARIIQLGCLRAGVRLGHCGDVKDLDDDLRSFAPTFLLAVPRVFEKIFNAASQNAAADGRGPVFDAAVRTAIDYSRAIDGPRVPLRLRARHALYSRLVYGRLRAALGGACRYAVSGGAPLGERLGHVFRGVGVPVLEGYGLTESAGALTVNLPDAHKVGTVGRPLPGVTVRVADDGELLFRGAQVFDGYWAPPGRDRSEATAQVLDGDGWLRTGDVGEVDDEGFVRVTGRKTEILVTAGGKNVAPAVLEDRLRAHPLVSQCLVVGDGQPFVGALVTIDEESFPAWAEAHGKRGTVADLVDDPDLRSAVADAVEEANAAVSKAESIRRFAVLGHDWTEEAGQLTPSLKLRRSVVLREHRDDIADLYR
ncbi:long-chain fatty acid--CoA ligase [uncultured Nocardioides sp.]|uniref:AMP-dependent synthetase/ligase n=1 Tax=uncultured Nocardioides sp. TaxID=198441 RepID=UPI002617CF38|nr:AMP-dependent synthetase/ligase [uncultured Nocardioides sp.]